MSAVYLREVLKDVCFREVPSKKGVNQREMSALLREVTALQRCLSWRNNGLREVSVLGLATCTGYLPWRGVYLKELSALETGWKGDYLKEVSVF